MEQIKQAWEIMSGGQALQKIKEKTEKKRKFEEEFKRATEDYHKKNPWAAPDARQSVKRFVWEGYL